ncbi:hypothetical protein C2S51_036276 [Perilla frutescens var. frutescens]|nr:hypothetical protein C2S51_036276 [Perilla frutescens var. frutescens]
MANKEVEMEDTQKPDSGNGIKESEDKVLDSKIEMEGNDLAASVTAAGNGNKSENGGDDLNKLINEAEDQITAMSEVEDKTNHESETNEPMLVEGIEPAGEQIDTKSVEGVEPTAEQIDTKRENEEAIGTEANAEVQTAVGSIVDKLTDAENEVVEKSDANDGLKEENPVENDVEGKNHVNGEEGDSSGDVAVEKPNDSKEDEGFVKHVEKKEMPNENADSGGDSMENRELQTGLSSNETPHVQSDTLDEVPQGEDNEMENASNANEDKLVNDEPKQQGKEIVLTSPIIDGNTKSVDTVTRIEGNDYSLQNQREATTPNSLVRYLPANMVNNSGEADKTVYAQATLPLMAESDDGTPEDQAGFIRELEGFYRERAMDFKPPKFYGQPLNCLKLWRAVIRLGGYDRVTGSKLWRQVGESFHPPKTCTTVSWTFRIFYEKSLLEYERHKRQSGDLQLPVAILPEASGADSEGNGYQGSGSGRARRDAAARAMQGWHVQRLFGYGEVGEPAIKDKNINNIAKREKSIKSIASLKQKRPNEAEHPVKAARTETAKQLVTSVVDIGPPADWVKINVRQMKDCFEVYALVPGLLREEVRVQSDPAGRLVITGQPEQVDNPWGITPFKKVVSLPGRIDPLQTSAVVSLHGRLFVRVPFESNS